MSRPIRIPFSKHMLGRYEYTDAKSNKFWEIRMLDENEFEATWGRIGATKGQSTTYDADTAFKKINEKIAKGYVQVGRSTKPERPYEAVRKPKTKPVATSTETSWLDDLAEIARRKNG